MFPRGRFLALDAEGNFFWSPRKFVAAIGVRDLVVVETPDALLVCPRERAQDVGQVVKWLEAQRLRATCSETVPGDAFRTPPLRVYFHP